MLAWSQVYKRETELDKQSFDLTKESILMHQEILAVIDPVGIPAEKHSVILIKLFIDTCSFQNFLCSSCDWKTQALCWVQ